MLKLFFLLCSIFTLNAYSQNRFNNNYPTDPQTLRFYVEPKNWFVMDRYLLKGTFFKVTIPNRKNEIEILEVFENLDFTKKANFEIFNHRIKTNKEICNLEPVKSLVKSKSIIRCSENFCEDWKVSSSQYVLTFKDLLEEKLLIQGSEDPCSEQINFFVKRENEEVSFYFNKLIPAKDSSYMEVNVGSKKFYIKTPFCKDNKELCKEITISQSSYEKDMDQLKLVQNKKDSASLNYLIKKLLPCVKTKDKTCVEKFLVTKADIESEGSDGDAVQADKDLVPQKIIVSDDLLRELEACLDYTNLLPYLYASKGINKVCVFGKIDSNPGILSITFPEAVVAPYTSGPDIYVVP